MTKLAYLAAMALLGLGLTMAQSSSPPSDSSNSSKAAQSQSSPDSNGAPGKSSRTDHTSTSPNKRRSPTARSRYHCARSAEQHHVHYGRVGPGKPAAFDFQHGHHGQHARARITPPRPAIAATTPQNGMPHRPAAKFVQQPQHSHTSPGDERHSGSTRRGHPHAGSRNLYESASLQNGQDATSAQRPSPNCD